MDITDNKYLETQKWKYAEKQFKPVKWQDIGRSTLPTEGNPISATRASPDFITSNPSPFVQHHNQTDSSYSDTCQVIIGKVTEVK